MRLAHFSWEFPPSIVGGLGTFAGELASHQVAQGHQATVLSHNYENAHPTVDTWKGVEIHRPMIPDLAPLYPVFANDDLSGWGDQIKFFSDVMTYNTMAAAKLIHRLIRKDGAIFDLVHSHDWLGIPGGICASREARLPLVFHVHSAEQGRSMGPGSPTVAGLERAGGRSADTVVTVSHAMKEELTGLGLAPPERIKVCWNGVDTSKYSPDAVDPEGVRSLRERYGISGDHRVILFVGRLVNVKGAEQLVEAMPSILRANPDARLVILGVGGLERSIADRVSGLGLQGKVLLRYEFVPEDERILHYAMSDVCVFPSLYEPFGIVCTEAMSMGKPVVVGARGTSGMREQIIHEGPDRCGLHVNGSNPGDIAWGLNEVLSSDSDSKAMGLNARKRAVEVYDWEIITRRMTRIYRECVERRGG